MQIGKLILGDRTIAEPVEVAAGFFERMCGLLGRDEMAPGSAMIIERCGSVHTICMRFSIDLIFLDCEWRVLSVKRDVKPGRPMVSGGMRAKRVVECIAGGVDLADLNCGDQLTFLPLSN